MPRGRRTVELSCCWSSAVTGTTEYCEPDFSSLKKNHFQNKFCEICRAVGFKIEAERICVLLPTEASWSNGLAEGFWSTREGFEGRVRIINQLKSCNPPSYVILEDASSASSPLVAPIPANFVDQQGLVHLIVSYGTLRPLDLATLPVSPARGRKRSIDQSPKSPSGEAFDWVLGGLTSVPHPTGPSIPLVAHPAPTASVLYPLPAPVQPEPRGDRGDPLVMQQAPLTGTDADGPPGESLQLEFGEYDEQLLQAAFATQDAIRTSCELQTAGALLVGDAHTELNDRSVSDTGSASGGDTGSSSGGDTGSSSGADLMPADLELPPLLPIPSPPFSPPDRLDEIQSAPAAPSVFGPCFDRSSWCRTGCRTGWTFDVFDDEAAFNAWAHSNSTNYLCMASSFVVGAVSLHGITLSAEVEVHATGVSAAWFITAILAALAGIGAVLLSWQQVRRTIMVLGYTWAISFALVCVISTSGYLQHSTDAMILQPMAKDTASGQSVFLDEEGQINPESLTVQILHFHVPVCNALFGACHSLLVPGLQTDVAYQMLMLIAVLSEGIGLHIAWGSALGHAQCCGLVAVCWMAFAAGWYAVQRLYVPSLREAYASKRAWGVV